jgi:hypothetical protein
VGGIQKFKRKPGDLAEFKQLARKFGRCYVCGDKPEKAEQKAICSKNENEFRGRMGIAKALVDQGREAEVNFPPPKNDQQQGIGRRPSEGGIVEGV